MKPAFIGLGAQKCASTWLHRVLAAHPAVAVPKRKELDFFSNHFDFGYQWYEDQFPADGLRRCAGEISPSYFHDCAAPARVRCYNPDIKLIVTLREPVERALSNHRHAVRLGHVTGSDLSFETGLTNNPMYVEQSRYGKHLSRWLSHFPKSQVCVVLVDDIRRNPAAVARQVFEFLGIDPTFEPPDLTRRFNPSYANRSQRLVELKDRAYELTQQPGLGWLWGLATGVGARAIYRRLNIIDSSALIPPVCGNTLDDLRGMLAADVRKLEDLLGRDLDQWLQGVHRQNGTLVTESVV